MRLLYMGYIVIVLKAIPFEHSNNCKQKKLIHQEVYAKGGFRTIRILKEGELSIDRQVWPILRLDVHYGQYLRPAYRAF